MRKLLFFVYFICSIVISQNDNQDNANINYLLSINHSFQIPSGDLKNRFGNNSDISISLIYKNSKNLIIQFEGGGLFGPTVKETNLFDPINGENGVLISQNGEIPIIRLFQRGGHMDLSLGKYFKLKSVKNNSGIVLSVGAGYLYHKIFIETITTELPQLNDELIKGYDRLSGGVLIKEFLGYFYFSKTNNIRFLIGLEAIQAFTKDLRNYSYTNQSYINDDRRDYLIGLKCGLIIQLKKRDTGKYYYY